MHINREITPPTKCHGDDCAVRMHCWRFRAPAERLQDYYPRSPEGAGTLACDGFWRIRKHDWLILTGKKKGEYL